MTLWPHGRSWQLTKYPCRRNLTSHTLRNGQNGYGGSRGSVKRWVYLKKGDEGQVNTLIYTMGDQADDILMSFGLSAGERKKYDTIKEKSHFVKKRNVIFEWIKFNQRKQDEGESMDTFITSLYSLAEYCQYRALHDDMIWDLIVVGLQDA